MPPRGRRLNRSVPARTRAFSRSSTATATARRGGFQHWANHLACAALIEAGAQQIGERNPTVEDLSHPAWQWGTLEDMESEYYESNQGSVRPKASI